MHTLKLNIQDSVFDKVIYFLQNLPKHEVSIIEDKIADQSITSSNNKDSDIELQAFSNHTASLIQEWQDETEDDVWK